MNRLILKRIPDQKVLVGAKSTVIDLGKAFPDFVISTQPDEQWAIILNKKEKVAKATIEGNQLILDWQGVPGSTEIILHAKTAEGEVIESKFSAEAWEADFVKMAMWVIGGLGIFLLGMRNMSDGLQAIAGSGLRRMISLVTDNRLLATVVGMSITMFIQSSSITTVMVVGFVNSGFMTLSQAIGVIMGANIGTTITGWILVLNIGKYGLPMLGGGAFAYLFLKQERWRYIGMVVMGLGMVFFGLELMKDGFIILKDLPEFEVWLRRFSADDYPGVLKCVAVGCALTCIVQSSSAMLGITIVLAQINVIDFPTAAALVFGENIGTTITAFLASFGTSTNAKRAAYFHIMFNVIGVLWITAIFTKIYYPYFLEPFVAWTGGDTTAGIAAAHTGFNAINTILFLPFTNVFARFLTKYVPDRVEKGKPQWTHLDVRLLDTPTIAIEQSRVEVLHMGEECVRMMKNLSKVVETEGVGEADPQAVREIFHSETMLDTVQDEIVAFMTDLLTGSAPHEVVEDGRRQIRMADEYESVSDYITTILKSYLRLQHSGLAMPEQSRHELRELHRMVFNYLELVARGYERRQAEVFTLAKSDGEAITKRVKELREDFLQRMTEEAIDPQLSVAYTAQLNAYRRVRDHVFNIAEAIAGTK